MAKYKYNNGDIVKTKTGLIQIINQIKIKNRKAYTYKCLICCNEDNILEDNLKQKRGCNVCCIPSRKVLKGYNDLWTTHPKIAKLLKNTEIGYEKSFGSQQKEIFICPNCGYEKSIKIAQIIRKGFGCPKCGDGISYPNKFMFNLLEQLKVNFICEYSPAWIKPKKYDFYFKLDEKEYIVEMDGIWHISNNKINGRTKEESQLIDNEKDKLAKKYNIRVIRIDCRYSELEFIKNSIIQSELSKLLNFKEEDIDWLKCHEYACNSLVKVVCEMWNNDIKNTKDIAYKLKINRVTVIRYLHHGTKINICNYDSKKEMILNGEKNGKKNNKKQVICITTGEIYNSIAEVKNKLGIRIGACLTGDAKSAGRHLKTNEKLKWMYYKDYIKLQNKNPNL